MDFRPVVLGPRSVVVGRRPRRATASSVHQPVRLARPVGPTPREGTGLGTRG